MIVKGWKRYFMHMESKRNRRYGEHYLRGKKIDFKTKAKTLCLCLAEEPMRPSYYLWNYD